MSESTKTVEPQYSPLFDVKDKHRITRLGLMVNESDAVAWIGGLDPDLDKARRILQLVPDKLTVDPVFPKWYPHLFQQR